MAVFLMIMLALKLLLLYLGIFALVAGIGCSVFQF